MTAAAALSRPRSSVSSETPRPSACTSPTAAERSGRFAFEDEGDRLSLSETPHTLPPSSQGNSPSSAPPCSPSCPSSPSSLFSPEILLPHRRQKAEDAPCEESGENGVSEASPNERLALPSETERTHASDLVRDGEFETGSAWGLYMLASLAVAAATALTRQFGGESTRRRCETAKRQQKKGDRREEEQASCNSGERSSMPLCCPETRGQDASADGTLLQGLLSPLFSGGKRAQEGRNEEPACLGAFSSLFGDAGEKKRPFPWKKWRERRQSSAEEDGESMNRSGKQEADAKDESGRVCECCARVQLFLAAYEVNPRCAKNRKSETGESAPGSLTASSLLTRTGCTDTRQGGPRSSASHTDDEETKALVNLLGPEGPSPTEIIPLSLEAPVQIVPAVLRRSNVHAPRLSSEQDSSCSISSLSPSPSVDDPSSPLAMSLRFLSCQREREDGGAVSLRGEGDDLFQETPVFSRPWGGDEEQDENWECLEETERGDSQVDRIACETLNSTETRDGLGERQRGGNAEGEEEMEEGKADAEKGEGAIEIEEEERGRGEEGETGGEANGEVPGQRVLRLDRMWAGDKRATAHRWLQAVGREKHGLLPVFSRGGPEHVAQQPVCAESRSYSSPVGSARHHWQSREALLLCLLQAERRAGQQRAHASHSVSCSFRGLVKSPAGGYLNQLREQLALGPSDEGETLPASASQPLLPLPGGASNPNAKGPWRAAASHETADDNWVKWWCDRIGFDDLRLRLFTYAVANKGSL
ncbi:conserved hypothetical protein [Neospora caninum Liverpool]|uniref:Uncharacterized protein n=1 Tax=Neospora caninum (strain Liverpool) TaxID=572307 RepID=F0VDI5_NEOCL|nr:conserved hypothetical protein [Neospora caninum Liverpool]CBZ51778.1 conserved hypothetical protein [Neospora caninum Liverpool]|eukprot:XP_003881811.1 conserved hypothetical protein [Neospora caninum Liverpool]